MSQFFRIDKKVHLEYERYDFFLKKFMIEACLVPLELEEVTGLALASVVFFEGDLDWFSLAASDLAICWQLLVFLSVSSSDSL